MNYKNAYITKSIINNTILNVFMFYAIVLLVGHKDIGDYSGGMISIVTMLT